MFYDFQQYIAYIAVTVNITFTLKPNSVMNF